MSGFIDEENTNNNEREAEPQRETVSRDKAADSSVGRDHSYGQRQTGYNQPRQSSGSIMDINRTFTRPLSRSTSGEAVTQFNQAFRKMMDERFDEVVRRDYDTIILDREEYRTALSAVLFTRHCSVAGTNVVAVVTLMVEASVDRLKKVTENIGNRTVENITTPGDVADEWMWKQAVAAVKRRYGADVHVIEAGHPSIPKQADSTKSDQIYGYIFYSVNALTETMNEYMLNNGVQPPEPAFTVALATQPSVTIHTKIDYKPHPMHTAAGMPIRDDMDIMVTASEKSAGNTPHENSVLMSRCASYVDIEYRPPGPPAVGQIPITQHYYPRICMTSAMPLTNAITLENHLLALSSVLVLSSSDSLLWGGVFVPRAGAPTGNDVDIRDIGAIGYQVPSLLRGDGRKRMRIDTKSNTFNFDKLRDLLREAFHNQPLYSMHVNDAGDTSWIDTVFLHAARGVPEAREMIIAAADRLTLGNFRPNYPVSDELVVDDMVRLHAGFYIDPATAEKRDIRHIDNLAILNMYGKSSTPEADDPRIIEWYNTFNNLSEPEAVRTERRFRIMEAAIGENNIEVYGYHRRLTFTGVFLNTLAKALAAAGLVISPERASYSFEGNGGYGIADPNRFIMGSNTNSLFNYGTGGGGGTGANLSSMSRFLRR